MSIKIALDAMGGDNSPHIVLDGAEHFLQTASDQSRNQDTSFLIYGPHKILSPLLESYALLSKNAMIVDAPGLIHNHMKVLEAFKASKDSSMRLAIEAVHSKNADAVVSAGNTGVYMALSKHILGLFNSVNRPALPAVIPTINGVPTVLVDAGANIDCDAETLVQFAIMGEAFARSVLKINNPSVALLNIGSEEIKGHSTLHKAYQILDTIPSISFKGYVEGNDITHGEVNVIVTDGFSGNIALKSIEGTATLINYLMKHYLSSSVLGKVGAFIAQSSFKKIKNHIDPRIYNGAVLLGLTGNAIKSHGGTDYIGFANAISVAHRLTQMRFLDEVAHRVHSLSPQVIQAAL
jgi:glycerol-3-phosphate acyltransferase PlsX